MSNYYDSAVACPKCGHSPIRIIVFGWWIFDSELFICDGCDFTTRDYTELVKVR